jgi:hypothetical protein
MPTAPSFADYKLLTEQPFIKNGKYYVTVENPKTKNSRTVRWYSDTEYAKAYGKTHPLAPAVDYGGLRHARGFDNGPILVIRNNKPADEEWLGASIARYAVGIGWYIVSTATIPADTPSHFKFLLLGWKEFEPLVNDPSALSELLSQKAKRKEWVLCS